MNIFEEKEIYFAEGGRAMTELLDRLGMRDEIRGEEIDKVTSLAMKHIVELPFQDCSGCSCRFENKTRILHDNSIYCHECYLEVIEMEN
ncbi:hypothetical protein ABLB21_23705 [Vibrio parahaemolyticus]|jgi:hypothetical protein|uniref:hypothetical protein n=2 Tax=Vibrio parahaemolyticus TaxID=670 RepID=UPI0008139966|nr:hypothetical protein [Vibrio parahaemolyticus]EJG0645632.1 hypothetical protein [Vibrio parahaemolyticus]EKA4077547.1 hypothetical protein [Vibrio parahaemolyticus]OCP39788.1 hypothetical protein AKH06_22200 [Vibrio parahaemolyticus]HCG7645207.1 hypothetical protein [Vibrio parahaemolyticus]HCH2721689.1 hypothetical protein [Vibrio parahaemolyticus]